MYKKKKMSLKNITTTKLLKLFFFVIVITLSGSCENEDTVVTIKDDDSSATEQVENQTELFDGWALTYFENTTTPFTFVNTDGIIATVVDEDLDGLFDGTFVKSNDEFMLLKFDEVTQLPTQITTSENEVYLFQFKEDYRKLDIAYLKEGDFQYFRNIELDENDPIFKSTSSKVFNGKNAKSEEDLVDGFIFASELLSVTLGGIFCTTSIIATLASAGTAFPLLTTCGGFAIGFGSLLIDRGAVEADQDIFNGSQLLSAGINIVQCAPPTPNFAACSEFFLSVIKEFKDVLDSVNQENEDNISAALGALNTGFGQVKVTLTWNSVADVDLWVTEPSGNRIDYSNPGSASGGILDVDDVDGGGPENIYWEENAPQGTYLVQVNLFDPNGSSQSNYLVQLEINGNVNSFAGSLTAEGQVNDVTSFQISFSNKIYVSELSSKYISEIKTIKN